MFHADNQYNHVLELERWTLRNHCLDSPSCSDDIYGNSSNYRLKILVDNSNDNRNVLIRQNNINVNVYSEIILSNTLIQPMLNV